LRETFRSELLRPGALNFADGVADDADHGFATAGEEDAFRAKVVGVRPALEVVEAFELAE